MALLAVFTPLANDVKILLCDLGGGEELGEVLTYSGVSCVPKNGYDTLMRSELPSRNGVTNWSPASSPNGNRWSEMGAEQKSS